jgi:hypothetical protein
VSARAACSALFVVAVAAAPLAAQHTLPTPAPASTPKHVGLVSDDAGFPESLFAGLRLDLKTFTDKDSNNSALGLSFAGERTFDLVTPVTDHGVPVLDIAATLRSFGNISFDPDINPHDFSREQGGIDANWFLRSDPARSSADWTDVMLSLRLHGGFEADQQFTARNSTCGATLVVDTQAGPASALAHWNPFDLPFRFTRWMTGYEGRGGGAEVVNRAEAFPTVLLTAEQVWSSGLDPRHEVGDTTSYLRLQLEVAMSAACVRIGDYHVAAEVDYRLFAEPGAGDAVRGAGLDLFDYFVVALKVGGDSILGKEITAADGVFVSYRAGKLPFDQKDEDAFEVGFRVHF